MREDSVMKKALLTLAPLALLALSCMDIEENLTPLGTTLRLTATMEQPGETRTVISNEKQVFWEPGDAIKVFAGETSARFTCDLTAPAATAGFNGSLDGAWSEGKDIWAIYPYTDEAYIKNEEQWLFLFLTIPTVQTARAESFAQNMHVSVAHSTTSSLQFFNVGSGIRFRLSDDGVTKVVLNGKGYERLSGTVGVWCDGDGIPLIVSMPSTSDQAILAAPEGKTLQKDTWYYIETIPTTLNKGFSLTLYRESDLFQIEYTKPVTLSRGVYGSLGTIDLGADVKESDSLQGSGTEQDPFLISSLEDLLLMQKRVNSDNGVIIGSQGLAVTANTAYYRLTADLDMSPACNPALGRSWTPIGNASGKETWVFYGTFDGDKHSITNLYINSPQEKQGLFGQVSGVIRNLTVEGVVTGKESTGILAGYCSNASIEGCTSKGNIQSISNNIGGCVGKGSFTKMEYCVNEASVHGGNLVGGLVGDAYYMLDVKHCTNLGPVVANIGNSGGIAGRAFGTKIIDCTNRGSISGKKESVGGIAGEIITGGKVFNCINYGAVSGMEYVGGIGGLVSCWAIMYMGPGTVANSINLGKVEMTGGQHVGALAGYVGHDPSYHYTLYSGDYVTGAWLKNSYWQADINPGMNAYGAGTGIVENTFALTEAQMKGDSYNGVLYSASDGSAYNRLIDALNAGAVLWSKNKSTSGGDVREHIPLSGWEYASSGSYPTQTDLEARMPGQSQPIFEVSDTDFEFDADGGRFQVTVVSNQGYFAEAMQDWITEVSVETPENRPHTHIYTFDVEANPSVQERSGVVRFVVMPSTFLFVKIKQRGKKTDETGNWKELPFYHQSLAMRFTATWCQWCPYMIRSVVRSQELFPGKIQHLALHVAGSNLYFSPSETLQTQFNEISVPVVIVDGRILVNNTPEDTDRAANKVVAAAQETENTYGTESGLALRTTAYGQDVDITVDAYFKSAGTYKITVLLLEDGIVSPQENGGSSYKHFNVARVAATDITGDLFTVSSDLSSQTFNYTIHAPEGRNVNNMHVLVYIQKPFGSAPRIQSADYGDYYVDNCATVRVGENLSLRLVE